MVISKTIFESIFDDGLNPIRIRSMISFNKCH